MIEAKEDKTENIVVVFALIKPRKLIKYIPASFAENNLSMIEVINFAVETVITDIKNVKSNTLPKDLHFHL
jgi:hypothetical protein